MKEFREVIMNHAIDMMQREDPENTAYYQITWKEKPLDYIANYNLKGVYKTVP
jgi:hypothetical protein